MVKRVNESYGLMRVKEKLKSAVEVKTFEDAYDKIISAYNNNKFQNVEPRVFLNCDFVRKNFEVMDFFNPAKIIFDLANSYNVYLDRPNDPISCFVHGVASSLPQLPKMK